MTASPEAWPWSSFPATVGLAPTPELLTTDWILGQFATDRPEACRRYSEFVYREFGQPSPWANLRGGVFLGSEDFIDQFQPLLAERRGLEEIPRIQRHADRPRLDQLLSTDTHKRPQAAREAHVEWGYTLKEIAVFLGIHYATVSRMIKKNRE